MHSHTCIYGGPETTLAPPTIDAIRSKEASEHLTVVSSRPSSAPVGQRCGGSYPLHSLKCSPGEEDERVSLIVLDFLGLLGILIIG